MKSDTNRHPDEGACQGRSTSMPICCPVASALLIVGIEMVIALSETPPAWIARAMAAVRAAATSPPSNRRVPGALPLR